MSDRIQFGVSGLLLLSFVQVLSCKSLRTSELQGTIPSPEDAYSNTNRWICSSADPKGQDPTVVAHMSVERLGDNVAALEPIQRAAAERNVAVDTHYRIQMEVVGRTFAKPYTRYKSNQFSTRDYTERVVPESYTAAQQVTLDAWGAKLGLSGFILVMQNPTIRRGFYLFTKTACKVLW